MAAKTWKSLVVFSAVLLQAGLCVGALFAAPKSADKDITAFSVAGAAGVIDDKSITVEAAVPLFSGIESLPATFKTSGKSVKVGAKVQVSGKTPNDFTKPVAYTVTAVDGSTRSYAVRVLVPKVVSLSGYGGTMFVGSDGSLWGTGRNTDGQLGMGHTNSVYVPKQVLAGGVASVSLGYYHSLILKTDGSLWAAGYNKLGQLGNGGTTSTSTPVQVFADSVASAAAGVNFSLVVKTNGSLWVTGYNDAGQLGNGTTTNVSTPVQILDSGVASVSGGERHALIVKTDGSLWAMGSRWSRPARHRLDN